MTVAHYFSDGVQTLVDSETMPPPKGYDVRWFGARGDDTGDDAPAFNAALAAALLTGGSVFAPPGVYRWATDVTVPGDGLTLFGCGLTSVIHWPGGSVQGSDGGSHDPSLYRALLRIFGVNKFEVYGLRFQGDNGDVNGAGFVHATGAQWDMLSTAIAIGGGSEEAPLYDVAIHHCWFENLYGFSVCDNNPNTPSCHYRRVNISDNFMLWTGNGLNPANVKQLTVARNTLYNAEGIETLSELCGGTIADNIIGGAFNQGISVYGDGVRLHHNTVDMTECFLGSNGLDGPSPGILIVGCQGATIDGNVVINCPSTAFEVIPNNTPFAGRNAKHVVLSNNITQTTRTVGLGDALSELIRVDTASDVSIVGNTLQGVVGGGFAVVIGIGVFGSSRVTVANNNVTACQIYGIDLEASCSGILVAGNTVYSTPSAYTCQGSAYVTFAGNVSYSAATFSFVVNSASSQVLMHGNQAGGTTTSIDSAACPSGHQTGNSWN